MASRRDELNSWIDKTKRLQRKMAVVFIALAAISIGLLFLHGVVGTFALTCVALVAICSFWVTEAHNAAHRQKLAELARVEANGGKPLETAHRRWHH